MTPTQDAPSGAEAMREAVARYFDPSAFLPAHYSGQYWLRRREEAYAKADAILAPAGPIASELARLTKEHARLKIQVASLTERAGELQGLLVTAEICADRVQARLNTAGAMIASLSNERDEMERGKAAALGLQSGASLIIRQLEADRDAARADAARRGEEVTRLREAITRISEFPENYDKDGHSWSVGYAFYAVQCIGRAALATKETTDV